MKRILLFLLDAYQRFLSPLFGPRCRYHPSCSHYAATAIARFGSMRGAILAGMRLARCHPWSTGGLDPVPEAFPRPPWRRTPHP